MNVQLRKSFLKVYDFQNYATGEYVIVLIHLILQAKYSQESVIKYGVK